MSWRLAHMTNNTGLNLVHIHTDEGLTGIGASQSTPPQQVCDYLVGKDPVRRSVA